MMHGNTKSLVVGVSFIAGAAAPVNMNGADTLLAFLDLGVDVTAKVEAQAPTDERIQGKVVTFDRASKLIVVRTDQGEKVLGMTDNVEGAEKIRVGADVTIELEERNGYLNARKILLQ